MWIRAFGNSLQQNQGGTVDAGFDGDLWGLQLGMPLYAEPYAVDARDTIGIMIGRSGADGDSSGFSIGVEDVGTGEVDLDNDYFGAYWTRHWARGAYIDSVLMLSHFDGEGRSYRGIHSDIDGKEFTASVEGGIPIPLDGTWELEPQAQLIWQHQNMENTSDHFAVINFDHVNALTARVGGRFVARIIRGDRVWRPYFKANIWHEVHGKDQVRFNGTPIITYRGQTSLEAGLGVTLDINETTSFFGILDYTEDLDSTEIESVEARIGFYRRW